MIPGQLTYDLQAPPEDPLDGVSPETWDDAKRRCWARGNHDPSDDDIAAMCMVMWNEARDWDMEP